MNEQQQNGQILCLNCRAPMADCEVTFNYLNYTFTATLPYCPACGQVYVTEELARGKMREVELSLEDK